MKKIKLKSLFKSKHKKNVRRKVMKAYFIVDSNDIKKAYLESEGKDYICISRRGKVYIYDENSPEGAPTQIELNKDEIIEKLHIIPESFDKFVETKGESELEFIAEEEPVIEEKVEEVAEEVKEDEAINETEDAEEKVSIASKLASIFKKDKEESEEDDSNDKLIKGLELILEWAKSKKN